MAKAKNVTGKINTEFAERFRAAYFARFKTQPTAQHVNIARKTFVQPALDKTWPDYEKMTLTQISVFTSAAAHKAVEMEGGE